MRLAHLADVHLDSQFGLFEPQLARQRRQSIRRALRAALVEAASRQVEAILIAGDLYEHDRIAPDTPEYLHEVFAEVAPIPIFIAPGNHDWLGPTSLYLRSDWPGNVHVFRKDELERRELADGLYLWGAAHHGPAVTKNLLSGFRVVDDGIHLGLFHGAESSTLAFQTDEKAPYGPFRAEQISESGLSHLFTGHLHTPIDADRFTYPGNPEPLTFGEPSTPTRCGARAS